jgi:hypothetical protein
MRMSNRSRFLGAALVCSIATAGCEAGRPAAAATSGGTGSWLDGGSGDDAGPDAGTDGGPDAGIQKEPDGGELRVLFIGDSYTYVNDLPGVLAAIARTSGMAPTIAVSEVVQGGATLENQWDNGIAQSVLADGGWTFVVLQGQSIEPFGDSQSFLHYGQIFGDLILDAGAEPALFVTWAEAPGSPVYAGSQGPGNPVNPAEMQDELTIGYDQLARELPTSVLACVGPAFEAAEQHHPEIPLIQDDFSHPTVQGTYLAACTFYVALTGKAVPAASSVPAGVSLSDAAALRDIAAVGRDCADAGLRALVELRDVWGGADSEYARSDGGTTPFDFGAAGIVVPSLFYLHNGGGSAAELGDGLALAPPFAWTSGAYPGGTGIADSPFQLPLPFCGDSLAPAESCAVSVSFLGTSSAEGAVSIALAGAYTTEAARAIQGEATSRALLSATMVSNFFALPNPLWLFAEDGGTQPFTLLLVNRGGAGASAITAAALEAPFAWGADGGAAFPGGVGSIAFDGGAFSYCSGGSLAQGAWCAMTGRFSPSGAGPFQQAAQISYGDEVGSVAPGLTFDLSGQIETDASDGGSLSDSGLPPFARK